MSNELLDAFNNMLNDNQRLDSKVLLIDGMNTFIRSFAAIPTMDQNGNHIGGVTGFLKSMAHSIRLHKPKYVYVIFDGRGGSKRRREVYPEYKQGRKLPTRLNRTYDMTSEQDERDLIKYEMVIIAKTLLNLPVTTITIDNVEADDIISYISKYYSENTDHKSIIYSTDKDFLQLVNDKVSIWNPIKKKEYTPDKVVEDYSIHPNNFLLYRTLIGDKSDNIPGIKGLGLKTLLKHIPELSSEKIISLPELIAMSQDINSKSIKKISDHHDILERNLYLMSLSDANMSDSNKLKVLDRIRNPDTKLDKFNLTKLLVDTNILPSLNLNYDQWIASTFNSLVIHG